MDAFSSGFVVAIAVAALSASVAAWIAARRVENPSFVVTTALVSLVVFQWVWLVLHV